VLAGTSGSRLFPVSDDMPKALLPVGNRPLLSYVCGSLKRCRGGRVVVVTTARFEGLVRSAVEADLAEGVMEAGASVVVADEMVGSAGALREALRCDEALRKCSEIVVMSGESVVGWRCLLQLVDRHRVSSAGCTALFAARVAPVTASGKKEKIDASEIEFVALEDDTNILVEKRALLDIEDEEKDKDEEGSSFFKMAKAVLRRSPKITLRADLVDVHCYVFDAELLDKSLETASESLKADVVPALAETYYRSKELADRDESHAHESTYERYQLDMTSSSTKKKPVIGVVMENHLEEDQEDDDVLGANFCLRVSTVSDYARLCRRCISRSGARLHKRDDVFLFPRGKLSKRDSTLVGADVTLGEKANFKHSTVGARCCIGPRAKINNSILFDDVQVHDGAVVQNSILCSKSIVKEKANLNDVQVGANAIVPPNTILKSEPFTAGDDDDDDDDLGHLDDDDDDLGRLDDDDDDDLGRLDDDDDDLGRLVSDNDDEEGAGTSVLLTT